MKNLFKVFVMLFVFAAFVACESATNSDATPEGDATEQVETDAVEPEVPAEEPVVETEEPTVEEGTEVIVDGEEVEVVTDEVVE